MPSAIPQKPATRSLLHYLAAASAILPIVNAVACAYQPGIRAELIAASGCGDSEIEMIDPDQASLGPGRWMGRCRDRFFTCGWRAGSVECGPAAAPPAGGGWAPTWGAATRVLLEG